MVNVASMVFACWSAEFVLGILLFVEDAKQHMFSVLKSKYFPNSSFWIANTLGPRSAFWSSIMQVKKDLCDNTVFQLHAGNISIWSTPWCPIWKEIHDHLLLPVTISPLPSTASDLWIPNTHKWNVNLLINIFDDQAVQQITSIRSILSSHSDLLRWKPSKTGACTTKEIYKHLLKNNII